MPARFSPAFPHCFPDDSGIEIVGNGDKVPEWRLERSRGFSSHEVNTILGHVEANMSRIVEQWNEFFND